jgi:hypothetical protein
MMHGHEKSDFAIVAVKPANKAEQLAAEQSAAEPAAAEPVERRAETKGNAGQQSTHRTLSWVSVSQALERIRQVSAVMTRGRRSYGAAAAEVMGPSSSLGADGGCPVTQVNDLSPKPRRV